MDLTSGISNMQNRLAPDAVGGFTSGYNTVANVQKTQQELAKNQIDLEQKRREQDIQNRLQKAIEESYNEKTGQPDYNKLALLGHKYGISAQQMDYAIKHIKDNWAAISEVAQNKQTTESIAAPGWNGQAPSAPVAPKAKEVESTTKGVAPVTQAPETPVAPVSTSATQLKDVQPLTEAQGAITGADNTGIDAVNGIIAGLRTAVDQSGNPTGAPIPTRPQITSPAMDAKGNVIGTAGDSWNRKPTVAPVAQVPAQVGGATMDLGEGRITAEVPQNTLYQNLDQMQTQNYGFSGAVPDVSGATVPASISEYTIPRNVYTDAQGNIKEYTPAELTANPSLDIAKSAESFFRAQTGDNKSAPDIVARNYLAQVRSNSLAANGVAVPPPRPIVGTPAAIDKWRQDMAAWQNSNAKALGKAEQDVQEVKAAVAKGRFDIADKIMKAQADTISIDGKEYRAYNGKARDAVASLNAIDPIAKTLAQEIHELRAHPGDTTSLQTVLPTFARVMGARMSPGAQISMGNIEESKMSSLIEDGQHAGLSIGGALAALAGWMMDSGANKKTFAQYAKEYATGAIKNISMVGVLDKMERQLAASKASAELYKEQNLIGYKRPQTGGNAPSDLPEGTPEPKVEPTAPVAPEAPVAKKPWSKEKPAKKEAKKETKPAPAPATPAKSNKRGML